MSEIFPDKNPVKILGYCLKEVKERILKKRGMKPVQPREPLANPSHEPETVKPYKLTPVTITKAELDLALSGRDRDRKFKRVAIPIDTARRVWERDNYCCQRKLRNGEICRSTYQCQLDHDTAVADGGTNGESNLRVHCRMHNLDRARERFGTERIAQAIAARKAKQAQKRAAEAATVEPSPTLFGEHASASGTKRRS